MAISSWSSHDGTLQLIQQEHNAVAAEYPWCTLTVTPTCCSHSSSLLSCIRPRIKKLLCCPPKWKIRKPGRRDFFFFFFTNSSILCLFPPICLRVNKSKKIKMHWLYFIPWWIFSSSKVKLEIEYSYCIFYIAIKGYKIKTMYNL